MTHPRYLIAKYVANVFRNEPRNIGLIVWTENAVIARFLGEKPHAPGEVDEAAVPKFVNSPAAYAQWIEYWRRELAKPNPTVFDTRPDPRAPQPASFSLADGGQVLVPVPDGELPQVLDELFAELVEEPAPRAWTAAKAEPRHEQVVARRHIQLDD